MKKVAPSKLSIARARRHIEEAKSSLVKTRMTRKYEALVSKYISINGIHPGI